MLDIGRTDSPVAGTKSPNTFEYQEVTMPNGSVTPRAREQQSIGTVAAWRRDQLVAGGFPRLLAFRIAHDPGYDLHALLDLVEAGCAPELAVRILAPADAEEAA